MEKTALGAKNSLYPMPTTLVGTLVDGKINYITMAHVGIHAHSYISLGMRKIHYSNQGIKENKTFSVNIPSADLIKQTDYCGLHSGQDTDKSTLFTNFFGRLETAPMIRECPLNMECRLTQTLDYPHHDVFIGEVVETYCDESFLTDGQPDMAKIQPLLFVMHNRSYYSLGRLLAPAWNVGKDLKK